MSFHYFDDASSQDLIDALYSLTRKLRIYVYTLQILPAEYPITVAACPGGFSRFVLMMPPSVVVETLMRLSGSCRGNLVFNPTNLKDLDKTVEKLERDPAFTAQITHDKSLALLEPQGNIFLDKYGFWSLTYMYAQVFGKLDDISQAYMKNFKKSISNAARPAEKLREQGNAAYRQRHLDEAVVLWSQALDLFVGIKAIAEAADCDGLIGNALIELGRPQEALKHFERGIKVFGSLRKVENAAGCVSGAAIALRDLGRYEEAIEHLERVRRTYEYLGFQSGIARCDNAIGTVLTRTGEFEEAIQHHQKAKKIYARLDLDNEVAQCDGNIAAALSGAGRQQEAISHYRQARDIFERLGLEHELAATDWGMGSAFRHLRRPVKAIEHLEAAVQRYQTLGMDREADNCMQLIYYARNDYGRGKQ